MKKFAVFGLLTILLISFGSCRNEEILEDKENSKQLLELINSKSLWKENITFISKAKKSFEKRVNKKYFINAHGFPIWEYSLSFEKENEPYIFVPIFKKGEITEVLLIVKKEEKIFLYYVKEKSKIEFFNILIYGNAHASNRNTSHLRVYCGWRTFEWIWENNDGSTDTNYTTEYFCLDINEASIDYNTDGGGGIMLGDYIGGSDWGPPIDLPLLNDPCKKAKTASATATTNSKNTTFTNAKTSISGMNNNKENGVVFGNVNGTTQSTGLQTGGEHSITLTHSFSNPTGDLHNHTDNTPPSPGDVYSLINARNNFANYNTRYVTTPDGTIYALVVTDTDAMNNFLQNYPPSITPNPSGGNYVNFPTDINNEYNDIYTFYNGTREMALAFTLDKYNSGIVLTKMNSNGDLKKIGTTETINSNGEKTYLNNNCQ